MKTKFLSMLLAIAMMLTMLAACDNEPVDDVDNPDDQQQEENQGGEEVSDVLTLVADGVSDYVIVRGENAYRSEVTASTELQNYIKQISSVEIPIVTDATEPVEKEIVVGKTNRETEGEFDRDELGDEGLVIKTNGQKLFLVGGEQRGTLYAVYEFLESYLGCRFYSSDFEVVPESKTISLEKIAEDKQIPVFVLRETDWSDYIRNIELEVKRKYNGNRWLSPIPEDLGGSNLWAGSAAHTFDRLLPPSVYLSEHPEYYNASYARDGKGQPCLTNENVYEIILQSVRDLLAANPNAKYISVSQNDNENYCKCDNCMAMVEKYGTYGGLNIWFVNRIAEAIKDEYPNVMIHTFAYRYTRHVPHDITVADNVMVELCSIEQCFRHPLEECTEYSHEDFAEILVGWGKICNNVSIWDYTTNYNHYAMTFPNFDVLRQNLRLFADNNVKLVLESGDHNARSLEFGELRGYLLSKLLWDPYISEEEYNALMVEFLQDYYGAGWEKILEYINLALDSTENICFGIYSDPNETFDWPTIVEFNPKDSYPEGLTVDMIKNYETVDWSQYWNWYKGYTEEPKILSEGEKLFQEAIAAAETDEQKMHLDKSYTQIQYLRSYYLGLNIRAGSGAIGKIVGYFMQDHPDDFSADDVIQYRFAITKLSNSQGYDSYSEFNKSIAEKALSYNISHIKENKVLDLATLDFTQLPDDWYN